MTLYDLSTTSPSSLQFVAKIGRDATAGPQGQTGPSVLKLMDWSHEVEGGQSSRSWPCSLLPHLSVLPGTSTNDDDDEVESRVTVDGQQGTECDQEELVRHEYSVMPQEVEQEDFLVPLKDDDNNDATTSTRACMGSSRPRWWPAERGGRRRNDRERQELLLDNVDMFMLARRKRMIDNGHDDMNDVASDDDDSTDCDSTAASSAYGDWDLDQDEDEMEDLADLARILMVTAERAE